MEVQVDGFDWDDANVGHIQRHSVTPSEVEEAVARMHVTAAAESAHGEKRWKLFGKTASGRHIVVVFTIRCNLFRTITAYRMNMADRRRYAPQID
ncbi:MAG: BrnT family toxin [Candidatus Acidiferrales bacterium]